MNIINTIGAKTIYKRIYNNFYISFVFINLKNIYIFPYVQVTQLKISSNPFAKGFRDDGTNDV